MVRPTLRPIAALPDSEQLVRDVVMDGTDIHYGGNVGTISIMNSTYELYPFEMVDCSDCGGDGQPRWFELHSMIGAAETDLGFGILYLYVNRQDRAYLSHYIRFNPVHHGVSPTLMADWFLQGDGPSPQAGWRGLP